MVAACESEKFVVAAGGVVVLVAVVVVVVFAASQVHSHPAVSAVPAPPTRQQCKFSKLLIDPKITSWSKPILCG